MKFLALYIFVFLLARKTSQYFVVYTVTFHKYQLWDEPVLNITVTKIQLLHMYFSRNLITGVEPLSNVFLRCLIVKSILSLQMSFYQMA